MKRRSFLAAGLLALGGSAAGVLGIGRSANRPRGSRGEGENALLDHPRLESGETRAGSTGAGGPRADRWEEIRTEAELDPSVVHLAGILVASHPGPVRRAIEAHRRAIDGNPAEHVAERDGPLKARARRAGARYLGARERDLALTDSTTMGTALVMAGLRIRADQEMLTATDDYYSTHASLRTAAERSGASIRKVPLYGEIQRATRDEVVDRIADEIGPETRVVTATWVHSATGLRVPIRELADRIAEKNRGRAAEDRALFFVDGVHGLGVEDADIPQLGCDFFAAGAHKWLLGPRGTGVLWGHPQSQGEVAPTIPTFIGESDWGSALSPGGFKAFEHQWALAEAFELQSELGRGRVHAHIHGLAERLKEGLLEMDHIELHTPRDASLTAGIVCFEVRGQSAAQTRDALAERNIIASRTPYSPPRARLTPGIYNTEADIDAALRALRALRR